MCGVGGVILDGVSKLGGGGIIGDGELTGMELRGGTTRPLDAERRAKIASMAARPLFTSALRPRTF